MISCHVHMLMQVINQQHIHGVLVACSADSRLLSRCVPSTSCMQVACCNIHFIDEGVFRMNTSQTVACFKEDFSPVDLPRKLSLCTWTLLPEFPEVLVVPDALQDIRFDASNPAVHHPHLLTPEWTSCLYEFEHDTCQIS